MKEVKPKVKQRILWIDIAKALAILSVPVSHTIEIGSKLRIAIFSVHMPIFFILSGYTTRLATDWTTFFKRLKKNILAMIVPVLVVLAIFAAYEALRFGGLHLWPSKMLYIIRQYFILPQPTDPSLYNLTTVWFVIALFYAKVLMDIINIVIKSEKNYLMNFALGGLGVYLGVSKIHLLPYLDLIFVGMMFIQIGILWREYEGLLKKYTLPLVIVAFFYWLGRALRGDFIELYTRFYAGYEISILESLAGVFMVCNFMMMLEESAKKAKGFQQNIVNGLVFIGQNTLLIYLIHCLDTSVFFFWDITPNVGLKGFIRLSLNLSIFVMLYLATHFFKAKITPCLCQFCLNLKKCYLSAKKSQN